MLSQQKISSWYKEPWPLFMVLLLLATIVYCGIRLHQVIVHQDYPIVDNYYAYGQSINQNLATIANAKLNNINATIYIDDLLTEVQLTLTGKLENWPQTLKLKLVSTAFKNQDIECELYNSTLNVNQASDIKYTGQLTQFIAGTYYVYLQPFELADNEQLNSNSWLLTTKTKITTNSVINLSNPDEQ